MADWPFVGRAAELARVDEVIGSGGHLVLVGPAGVGKTRLAREMADAFRRVGFATEWVIGTRAAATIPFGAIASLLPMPKARGTRGEPSIDTMASIREAVTSRASGRGLVLAVDDAHCLDDATATLVQQLATTTEARLLVTLRSGETSPEAVTALWKDGIADRLDLQPLSDTDIRNLLAEALGGPVEERTAWELTRRCAGNCLFLIELVRAAQDAGNFKFEQGRWRLKGELPTSTRLTELVQARTTGLPGVSRDLLEFLALGEPLPLSVLTALMGHAVLDDASRLGLIDLEQDRRRATVRLSHPLYGEVLRSGLPALRARTRARALVEAYESTPLRRSDDIVRFASWSLDAGMPAEPDLLLRAARRALEGTDLRTAERFGAAAVDQLTATWAPTSGRPAGVAAAPAPSGPGPSEPEDMIEQQTEALLILAHALRRQDRFTEAATVLDRVHPRAPAVLSAEVLELHAHELFLSVDAESDGDGVAAAGTIQLPAHVAEALAMLEGAERRFEDLPSRLGLRIARARLLEMLGRPLESLELLDRTPTPTIELEHRWFAVRGPTLASAGRFDEAEELMASARALPYDDVEPSIVAATINWMTTTTVLIACGRGELAMLETLMRGVLDHAKARWHPAMQRSAATFLGIPLFLQGRIAEAIELLIVGTDDIPGGGRGGAARPHRPGAAGLLYISDLPLAFGLLASAYACAGDMAAAQATLERADRELRTSSGVTDPFLAVGHALSARAQGASGHGREVLKVALARCSETGEHVFEMLLALVACQIGSPELAAQYTPELLETVDGPIPQVVHDLATASVAADARRLEAVSDSFERHGFLLVAAEIAAAAADIHDAAARTRQAITDRTRARHLLDRCPGADDAFMPSSGLPPTLTPRELEIARLAAAGLSSAEIARDLYLSTRTVDTHLGRVYIKLDVRGRADLKHHPQLSPQ